MADYTPRLVEVEPADDARPCPTCGSPIYWLPAGVDQSEAGPPRCQGCQPPPALSLVGRVLVVVNLGGGQAGWFDETQQLLSLWRLQERAQRRRLSAQREGEQHDGF